MSTALFEGRITAGSPRKRVVEDRGPKSFPSSSMQMMTPFVKKGKTFKKNSLVRKRFEQERVRKLSPQYNTTFQSRFAPVTFQTANHNKKTATPSPRTKQKYATIFPRISSPPKQSIAKAPNEKIHVSPPLSATKQQKDRTTLVRCAEPKASLAGPSPPTTTTEEKATSSASVEEAREPSAAVDDYVDEGFASFLCLVPLLVQVKENQEQENQEQGRHLATCYWPSLVFESLEDAMLYHNKLYPKQTKIQKRLKSKFMRASKKQIETKKMVILPLGDAEGCCPSEMCSRPLYDNIDISSSSGGGDGGGGYWRTISKQTPTPKVIEGGNKVIRLLENSSVVGEYLKELMQQIPRVVPALDKAIMELERLSCLDDEEENEPFVSSLKVDSSPPQPVTFPVREASWLRPKRKTLEQQASAVKFPLSSKKSKKRSLQNESSSASNSDAGETTTATTTSSTNQTTLQGSTTSVNQTRTSSTPWKSPSPAFKSTKRARLLVESTENAPTAASIAAAKVVVPAQTKKTKTLQQLAPTRMSPTTKLAGPKRKPTVIDSKAKISISSWAGVKPLLKQLGHVFYDEGSNRELVQFYCLPNGDPNRYPEAVEGKDYFHSMESYRAHLCAHGVEYFRAAKTHKTDGNNQSPLGDNDLELISYWVRFHVYTQRTTGVRKAEEIADLELQGNEGSKIRLLQRIGYKYECRGVLEGYTIPGEKKKRYLTEDRLWEHLGKYGLSPLCDFEKLNSPEEKTALEIQIIRKYHGNHGDKAFR